MGKYFYKPEDRHDKYVTITGNTAHHILHVMRLRIGQETILCDGDSTDYIATVMATNEKPPSIIFQLHSGSSSSAEPEYPITLFQGLPKSDKMDSIIEKCIEVGVTSIIPVCTKRSIVRVKDAAKKLERYSKIAEAAASQSMRGVIPVIQSPIDFTKALQLCKTGITLVAYENEREKTIKSALVKHPPQLISLWVGPEGGFDLSEIVALKGTGAIQVSLGPRILRTETAGIVAIAQIMNTWDEI